MGLFGLLFGLFRLWVFSMACLSLFLCVFGLLWYLD